MTQPSPTISQRMDRNNRAVRMRRLTNWSERASVTVVFLFCLFIGLLSLTAQLIERIL